MKYQASSKGFAFWAGVTLFSGWWFGSFAQSYFVEKTSSERDLAAETLSPMGLEESAASNTFENSSFSNHSDENISGAAAISQKSHQRASREAYFKSLFPDTEEGHALARLSVILPYGAVPDTQEAALIEKELAYLQSHPAETFALIREVSSKFNDESQTELTFLVHLVSELEVDDQSKLDFYSSEIARASDQVHSNSGAPRNMIGALSGLIDLSSDSKQVEPIIEKLLSQSDDHEFKEVVFNFFESKFPENAEHFRHLVTH